MKLRTILTIAIALCVAVTASAQDLKPVKEKGSKKFGYQDKSKNWVINPEFDKAKRFIDGFAIVEVQGLEGLIDQSGAWVLKPEYNNIGKFDKAGLCEVMVKDGRFKHYGLANTSGQLVIPPECISVTVSRTEELIYAHRDAEVEGLGQVSAWGVYNLAGEEIFPPEFSSSPTFRNGIGTARSIFTGRVGLIDNAGQVLLPFENLAIETGVSKFEVLAPDFSVQVYDSRFNKTEEIRSPGAVKPYDTFGDEVRAAAWHVACIGQRLHSNNVKQADFTRTTIGRTLNVSPLRIDWGYGRFIRLEPEAIEKELPGCMENPYTGKLYTLRAILYEEDGTYAGIASDWGWLEGEFEEGWVYNSQGDQRWVVFRDPNYPARLRSQSIELKDYYEIDNSSVVSGLLLGSYDLKRLQTPENRIERETEIIEGENTGICSYLPRPEVRNEDYRIIREAMHLPIFHRAFYLGEVVNFEEHKYADEIRIELKDNLVCHFEDRFDNPSFFMEGDEAIYWGPNNNRFVALDLEPAESRMSDYTTDDVYGSNRKYKILINMYDEDGIFLRTLGEAPAIDYIHGDLIVFEKLGIVLIANDRVVTDRHREIRIPVSTRLAPTLSALQGSGIKQATEVKPTSGYQQQSPRVVGNMHPRVPQR